MILKILQKQFERARDEGWLDFFLEAADQFGETVEDLMAVASRETEMGGRRLSDGRYEWLTRPGDGGNGFGLMQADRRSFPEWIRTGQWRDARKSILMGARVLANKRKGIVERAGRECRVKDSKSGKWYSFLMADLGGEDLRRAAIAAYNGGDWPLYHFTKGRPVDHGTTGRDYSADVLSRSSQFRVLINASDDTATLRHGDTASGSLEVAVSARPPLAASLVNTSQQPVVGGGPDDPPQQASAGGRKSLWTTISTQAAALGAGIWAVIKDNQQLLKYVLIVGGALAVVYLLRQTIMDIFRIRVASDPNKINAK